ncbi:Stp1/IreP family PP2C-type Ser/Thr phosphatase [Brunnivagina elsteri]|uniref:Serine/threonine protein phosphatase n=1 Tax=Brunnivagina elsteri CCALA 953 TaxID=987040 RepID=A0A2A2TC08_9CYAN|nr:Stp1/IreP family PP2C-type Ser/Thr phosphatase [Calothrix elsteri]PAX51327.1 serine/threonine protein phosphatase [Calothrix elsteri CCALA 953]
MKINFIGASDPGLIRTSNQDSFYTDPEGRFFIVADGMGGHAGGEEASRIASQEIQAYLGANWGSDIPSDKLLEEALLRANEAIISDQQSHPERSDMGTTAVVVVFREDSPVCAHVGDSRLYRWRDSQLNQITEDHTWVARALKVGDILPDEARIHPFRHVLSRCLGREDLQHIDVQNFDVQQGDRLLLCSDGLTEELVDEKIATHMQDTSMLDKASIGLIESAKEHGGHDNITVVLVAIDN